MSEGIPPWELLGRLGDDDVVVVDCRADEDFAQLPAQIPGAVRMSCEEIREAPWTLPDDELIVLYDGTHDSFRPRMAARFLRRAGRRAVVLEGGLRAWLSEGYPAVSPDERRVLPDSERVGLGG